MRIYASSACLPGQAPITQRLNEFAAAGLAHVEIGAGLLLPSEGFKRNQLPEHQHFLVHNYFPPPIDAFVLNLASANHRIRSRSLALVKNAISLSAELKAPFYSVHGGFVTDAIASGKYGFEFPKPDSPDEMKRRFDCFVDSVEEVLEFAEPLGVHLLIENNVCSLENKGKLLLQSAPEFAALFSRVDSPYLGMLFDTGHMNVSAKTFGFDRLEFVDVVTPFVRAFHVHENDGSADQHSALRDGSWILDVLRRPAFNACTLIVESKFPNIHELRNNIDWLQAQLAQNKDLEIKRAAN